MDHVSKILSERAVTCRAVVAELLDPTGDFDPNDVLGSLLFDLIYTGQAFPSAVENRDRAREIGRRLFGFDALFSLRELTGQVSKIIYGAQEDRARVVEMLREEVDWTFRNAVSRQLSRPSIQNRS